MDLLTVLPAATVAVPVVLAAAPRLQRTSVEETSEIGPLEFCWSGMRIYSYSADPWKLKNRSKYMDEPLRSRKQINWLLQWATA